jgi:cytochrome o ubiquinol oxidase operon protein cyoD
MHTGHDDQAGHGHSHDGAAHGSMKSYGAGFLLSILLTMPPFWMVMHPSMPKETIFATITVFAVAQILVHLVCFLHMNTKSEQRWNTIAFAFTVMIVGLLVGGSVWIMANANANLMPQAPMDLMHQE